MLSCDTEGLHALHRVLVKARFQSREGFTSEEVAAILDHAETLLSYVLSSEDMTELFQEELRALGEEHSEFSGIGSDYEAGCV